MERQAQLVPVQQALLSRLVQLVQPALQFQLAQPGLQSRPLAQGQQESFPLQERVRFQRAAAGRFRPQAVQATVPQRASCH